MLQHGWRSGRIRFERMSAREVRAMERREGKPWRLLALEPMRVDAGRRVARPLETRSKKLGAAKHTVKSPRRTDCIEDKKLDPIVEDGPRAQKRRRLAAFVW